MKKIIILLMIVAMSLVLPTSCVKSFLNDYLNKAPQQGLTDATVFTNLANFKAFFDAIYSGTTYVASGPAWDDYNYKPMLPLYFAVWDQKYSWEDVTDAADAGRYMEGHAWKSGNMSETIVNKMTYDAVRRPMLQSAFMDIRIANIALQKVNNIQDGTDNDKNDIRGQAYFFRAFCHLSLMNFWGPVPYLTKPMGPTDQWDLPRLSKHECLTKIAQDFDSSYYFFNLAGLVRRDPPVGSAGHNDYVNYYMYRPNGMAALGYKSRALLFRASPLNTDGSATDWTDAAAAAWQALTVAQANGAVLLPFATRSTNYWGAMVTDEELWSYTFGTVNWSGSSWPNYNTNCGGQCLWNGVFGNSTGSNSGISPTQNFVDKYETLNGDPLNTQADRDAATALGHYVEQNPYINRDPRLAADIIYNQSPVTNYTNGVANIYIDDATGKAAELLDPAYLGITKTGYYQKKFFWQNSTKNQVSAIMTDPLCRLAEIWLNYAEASNEAYGPTAIGVAGANKSAVDAINIIRARAGMPNVLPAYTGSTAAFRPRIKNERCVELSYEGHYYNDIHRWMDLQTIQQSTIMGVYIEKLVAGYDHVQYPSIGGFKYTRQALDPTRQPAWKPQFYYLPFNIADALKMKNFVANPNW